MSMRGAVAYVRVSTEDQGDNGIGLDAQLVQIEEFAKARGFKIERRFPEVASAMGRINASERHELLEAAKASKAHEWPIIVASLSRVSRNTAELERFVRDGRLNIMSATVGERGDNASISAAAARAQFEGEQISLRTRQALAKRKAEGVLLGNRTNLREAQILGAAGARAAAFEHLELNDRVFSAAEESGAKTPEEIADWLNKTGNLTRSGVPWTPANVRRVLRQLRKCMPLWSRYESPVVDPAEGANIAIGDAESSSAIPYSNDRGRPLTAASARRNLGGAAKERAVMRRPKVAESRSASQESEGEAWLARLPASVRAAVRAALMKALQDLDVEFEIENPAPSAPSQSTLPEGPYDQEDHERHPLWGAFS